MQENTPAATPTTSDRRGGFRTYLIGLTVAAGVLAALAFVIVRTSPVRGAIQTYMRLVAASNRGDTEAVKALCTPRFLSRTSLNGSGGTVLEGIPEAIGQNFLGWEEDDGVLFSTSDRVGPVYRMVREGDRWLFDGSVGTLRGDGRVDRATEASPADATPPVDSQAAPKPQ